MKSLNYNLIIVLSLIFCGCLMNYDTTASDYPTTNKTFADREVIKAIRTHLSTIYGDSKYNGFLFGDVYKITPEEVKKLDSLIEYKNQLPVKFQELGVDLDKEEDRIETEITKQKILLKDEQIYPWYEVNHLFSIDHSKDSVQVMQANFSLYPNYKIKDVNTEINTVLNVQQNETFIHFISQEPLFSGDDYRENNRQNRLYYDRFITALNEESQYKNELFHTILRICNFIIQNNNFDGDAFMKFELENWKAQHKDFNIYEQLNAPNISENILNTEEGQVIAGYTLVDSIATNSTSVSPTVLSLAFDLNFVLTSVTEIK